MGVVSDSGTFRLSPLKIGARVNVRAKAVVESVEGDHVRVRIEPDSLRSYQSEAVSAVVDKQRPVLTLMIPSAEQGLRHRMSLLRLAITILCKHLGLKVIDGPMPDVRLTEVRRQKRAVIFFSVVREEKVN
jgi:hypothetical protein